MRFRTIRLRHRNKPAAPHPGSRDPERPRSAASPHTGHIRTTLQGTSHPTLSRLAAIILAPSATVARGREAFQMHLCRLANLELEAPPTITG